jgi:pyruvate dehydrogenase E1 component
MFEPTYADELEVILRYAFSYMQDTEGSSVYLRLSTRNISQIKRQVNKDLEEQILSGGYWLEKPKNKSNITIIFSGVMATEVFEAVKILQEDDLNISILSITSSDRLYKNWRASQKERSKGIKIVSRIEELFTDTEKNSVIVSIMDAHSSSLTWIGGAVGKKTISLGVDEFGQSGNLKDLFHNYSIDADAIVDACAQVL